MQGVQLLHTAKLEREAAMRDVAVPAGAGNIVNAGVCDSEAEVKARTALAKSLNAQAGSMSVTSSMACWLLHTGGRDCWESHTSVFHNAGVFARALLPPSMQPTDDTKQQAETYTIFGRASGSAAATGAAAPGGVRLWNVHLDHYLHRGAALESLSPYELHCCYQLVKKPSNAPADDAYWDGGCDDAAAGDDDGEFDYESDQESEGSDDIMMSETAEGDDEEPAEEAPAAKRRRGRAPNPRFELAPTHPQFRTHHWQQRSVIRVPQITFDIPNEPSESDPVEVRERYAAFMLGNFTAFTHADLPAAADDDGDDHEAGAGPSADGGTLWQRLQRLVQNADNERCVVSDVSRKLIANAQQMAYARIEASKAFKLRMAAVKAGVAVRPDLLADTAAMALNLQPDPTDFDAVDSDTDDEGDPDYGRRRWCGRDREEDDRDDADTGVDMRPYPELLETLQELCQQESNWNWDSKTRAYIEVALGGMPTELEHMFRASDATAFRSYPESLFSGMSKRQAQLRATHIKNAALSLAASSAASLVAHLPPGTRAELHLDREQDAAAGRVIRPRLEIWTDVAGQRCMCMQLTHYSHSLIIW